MGELLGLGLPPLRIGSPTINRGKSRSPYRPTPRLPLNRVSSAPSEFDTEASDAPPTSDEEDSSAGLWAFPKQTHLTVPGQGAPGTAGTDSAWTLSGSEGDAEEWLRDDVVEEKGRGSARVSESEGEGGRGGFSPIGVGVAPPEEGEGKEQGVASPPVPLKDEATTTP